MWGVAEYYIGYNWLPKFECIYTPKHVNSSFISFTADRAFACCLKYIHLFFAPPSGWSCRGRECPCHKHLFIHFSSHYYPHVDPEAIWVNLDIIFTHI